MANDIARLDDQIEGLTPYQQARLRTNMWFGSVDPVTQRLVQFDGQKLVSEDVTFVQALATYFREIVDNALDEMVAKGFGNKLDIRYNPDTMVFCVEDNGRGIPLDMVRQVFTNEDDQGRYRYTGRNFRERIDTAGQNGVGACVTNFTSSFFRVTVWRDGKEYRQEFKENPFEVANEFGPTDLVVGKPNVKPYSGRQTGTRIEFQPSEAIYRNRQLPMRYVEARAWEIAAINPKLRVTLNGTHLRPAHTMLALSFFRDLNPIVIDINDPESSFRSVFYLVPKFTDEFEELVHSVVNNIPAYDRGGKHLVAFRSVFYNGLLAALAKESRRRKLEPNSSDASKGLLIYNVTRMNAPSFDSQSKTKLVNDVADKVVRRHFDGEAAFRKIIKEHPEWIQDIYDRCAARTQAKDENEARKVEKGLKRQRIAKLKDALARDRSKCILFLGEGDSAIDELVNARDKEFHAVLPLRGKVMNVHGMAATEIVKSEPLADMMTAIGLGRGDRAIRSSLRYGRVYIATDEDEDGLNIFGLLINFFYRGWPELFDPTMPPFFYRFGSPFILLKRGKETRYIYGEDYPSFRPEEWKGWSMIRAKGLGTLEKPDWKRVLAEPRIMPIVDDGGMDKALDLIFGPDADARKVWMGI